ncbi:MAG: divalent metal cation transporter [Planctomycetota bacterium]
MGDRRGILKALGPGFLFAAVSVGVSHLVQSTRAGAFLGFSLVPVILLAMLMKYPLFEFGQRYAAATGKSLLDGYRKQGRWALVFYILLTLGTMFTVLAAVTAITTGLAIQLTGIVLPLWQWSAIIMGICALLIALGRYPLLDKAIKVIMALLTLSTIAAVAAAVPSLRAGSLFGKIEWEHMVFIVPLIGWMPTGMDVSVWQSFWALARRRETGHRPTLRETLFDFRFGYIGTSVLALLFVTLGAAVMFDRGQAFDLKSSSKFAGQLVDLYTSTLGEWSRPVILVAALTTMLSTTLTVIDGFPRALQMAGRRFFSEETAADAEKSTVRTLDFWLWAGLLIAGAMIVIRFYMKNFGALVDLAITLSYVTGPFLGILTYRAMTAPDIPAEYRPARGLRILAIVGIVFLAGFFVLYLKVRLDA